MTDLVRTSDTGDGVQTTPRTATTSSSVILSAPMSFNGATRRLWRISQKPTDSRVQLACGLAMVPVIVVAWALILVWYVLFGLFLVPYRIFRRGNRNRTRQDLQHQEMLAAIERKGAA